MTGSWLLWPDLLSHEFYSAQPDNILMNKFQILLSELTNSLYSIIWRNFGVKKKRNCVWKKIQWGCHPVVFSGEVRRKSEKLRKIDKKNPLIMKWWHRWYFSTVFNTVWNSGFILNPCVIRNSTVESCAESHVIFAQWKIQQI